MANEAGSVVVDKPVVDTPKPDPVVPETNPLVEKAMQMGWKPEAEWEGDPEDWVDAKEFIGRQKIYDRLSDANKRVKMVEKTLNEFKTHHENVAKTEYERALKTLKLERIKALEAGDSETLMEVEDRIDDVKDKIREAKQAPKTAEPDPEFQRVYADWSAKNTWYATDPGLRKEADILGYAYVQMNGPGDSPEVVLKYIEKEIRQRHPNKFTNQQRNLPNMVEGGDGDVKKSTSTRKIDIQLSEDEERAMKKFVRLGVMTEAKYKEDLKKMREQG